MPEREPHPPGPSDHLPGLRGSKRFEVVGHLGSGGMGVVYEVFDRERQARMALKTLRFVDGGAIVRLKREFRALQDLQHPNLVTLGELIEESGQLFFTMELVPGEDFMTHVRPGRGGPRGSPSLALSRTLDSADEPALSAIMARMTPVLGTGRCDVARLRPAMAQLASGLAALHRARMVHRDVKPGNVRVTPEGRVVVLDFGLVAETSQAAPGSPSDPHIVGTAAYMAPEQAAALPVDAAADWYAVGVMLYEALAGRLPIVGPPLELLMAKQSVDPPPPRTSWLEAPADLDALCMELLRRDPATRPGDDEILTRLGVTPTPAHVGERTISQGSHEPPFVGRTRELAALEHAFADARAGAAVSVLIGGHSGVGKSTLVRQALAHALAATPGLLVLKGRCHERESVPYKAIDDIVDGLAAHLGTLPAAEVARLVPPGAELLATIFPQLTSVEAFARATRALPRAADPLEQRRQLFAALRQLLVRLCARGPTCLVIDDLQWADPDSLALLSALLTPPGEPPVVLLATLRDDAPEAARVSLPGDVRALELAPLPEAEARALAARLLEQAGAPAAAAAAIAEEAGGHPLYIDELARRTAHGADAAHAPRLDDALRERAGRLDPGTHTLLELIVLAGGPLRQAAAQRAAGGEPAQFLRQLAELRAGRFCRTSSGRGADSVEPWHARVREAIAAAVVPERSTALHQRLALALEAEPASAQDPEALARHFGAAGQPARAAGYAIAAARRATAALAFQRAARLYRDALDLGAPAGVGLDSLYTALGDALAAIGHGAEAADAYLRAAEDATHADAIELGRRAAEMRLRVGDFDAGVELLRGVLAPLGMRLPHTPRRALASLLVGRARGAVRGLGFRRRDPSQLSAEQLTRVDLCWSAAIGLGACNVIYGADFQTRHLRLALATGEPYRVARALAVEAAFASTGGARAAARTEALLARATTLAEEVGHPHALGLCQMARSMAAYAAGDFRATVAAAWPASEFLRTRCVGVEWEIALAHIHGLTGLVYLGDYAELHRRMPPLIADAERRGDRFASTFLRMGQFWVHLVHDRADDAALEVERAIAGWSRQGFHVQHQIALVAETQIALYRGDREGARARVARDWRAAERSLLMRSPPTRWTLCELRARSLLAWARGAPEGGPRQQALGQALGCVAPMTRTGEPWARGMALATRAAVDALRGEHADALSGYDAAERIYAESGLRGYVAAMRWRAAELDPSAVRTAAAAESFAGLRAEGTRVPETLLSVLAP